MKFNEKNLERFKKKFSIESSEIIISRLNVMPEIERTVFMARWGLDDGKFCPNFNILSKKLVRAVSADEYYTAETVWEESKYVIILKDKDCFDFDTAKTIGCLASLILSHEKGEEIHQTVIGSELLKVLNSVLKEKELLVLKELCGIEDGKIKKHHEVASKLFLSLIRVRQIEAHSLKKLRAYKQKSKFFIPVHDVDSVLIEDTILTNKVKSILKEAGYITVGELRKLKPEDFMQIEGLRVRDWQVINREFGLSV